MDIRWGWENPRSMYVLPLIHSRFPAMTFVHVLRDGRDMALSGNRNELHASPPPPDELTKCLSGVVAAKLGGALVRTAVLGSTSLDACQVSQFYQQSPVQKYTQLFHQLSIGNLAYAFGYDDTCEQSSFITVDSPTEVDIQISGGTPR